MRGIIVIVAYRPKPDREKELLGIVRNRVPTLHKEGLVTDRVPVIMRAKDGRPAQRDIIRLPNDAQFPLLSTA